MKQKIEVKFELANVTNKFLLHIKNLIDSITHIYYAIDKADIDIYKPLPTDSFPITIDDKSPKPTLKEQKQKTLNWVLTYAFEDLVNGLTKSLKEAYKYLSIYTLSQEPSYTKTEDELNQKLQNIEKESEELHFPGFIKHIERMLKKQLPFKDELLSINQVRNCFVHRHGIVSQKDIKHSDINALKLKWVSLKFYTEINGKLTEITYNLRKDGIVVNKLKIETIKNERAFNLGDKIMIDINEFNGIAYTCSAFAQKLFDIMPRPE